MTMLPPPSKVKLGLVIDLDICVGCHACAVACKEWNDGGEFGPLLDTDPYGAEPDGVWFNRVHTYEVQGCGTRDSGLGNEPGLGTRDLNTGTRDSGLGTRESGFADNVGREADERSTKSAHASAARLKKSGLRDAAAVDLPSPESRVPSPGLRVPSPALHAPSPGSMTIHFPRSCLHCETPDCVTVCPTGASYKRAEDGIVLVDADKCIGCQLCAWACPYGAREFNHDHGVMQKCTLCVDRIYNETLEEADRQPACVMACPTRARHFGDLGDAESPISKLVAERDGYALQPELGYQPVNRYLPPRPRRNTPNEADRRAETEAYDPNALPTPLRWLDRLLSR